ncbi:MAG: pirin family protein [Bacillota bacterium]|nr:pirin family protein [Bacillota bacterium]
MSHAEEGGLLVLPRLPAPPAEARERRVRRLVTAHSQLEGAGFRVRRPFPGPEADLRETDPFLLLDQIGPVEYGPREARGAPWHPHRGFETVTYILAGAFRHRDSNGGGGLIRAGDTQWMTAGSGILHDEMPPEELYLHGGLFHGVQLWVNLPRRLKRTPPRYQEIARERVTRVASADGGALLRIIAGEVGGCKGPGVTWTPIDYVHASIAPGARLRLAWRESFNALAYVLVGSGSAGPEATPLRAGQLAIFGPGEAITLAADPRQPGTLEAEAAPAMEVLLLGGLPIREPIAFYGPFVMNTREEILQAFEDFQAGRLGTVPATLLGPADRAAGSQAAGSEPAGAGTGADEAAPRQR